MTPIHTLTLQLRRYRVFLLIAGVSFFIRFLFIGFDSFKIDMSAWIGWGSRVLDVGFSRFYSTSEWTAYLPGYLYFLWITALFQHFVFPLASYSQLEILYKIFPITFDFGCAVIIYLTIRDFLRTRYSNRTPDNAGLLGSFIFILSPFSTFNSAIWGQADSAHTFFMGVSFYFLAVKKKTPLAFAFLAVATIIKPQSLFVSPLYLHYMFEPLLLSTRWKDKKIFTELFSQITRSAFYFLAVLVSICIPFFGKDILSGIIHVISANADAYGYNSLNTFNYWGIYGFWKPDSVQFLFNQTMKSTGYIFTIGSYLLGLLVWYFVLIRRKRSMDVFSGALFGGYYIFSSVMFLTQMHERYIYPFFLFFTIALSLLLFGYNHKYSRVIKLTSVVLFIIISMIHYLDIYYVYQYYMFFGVGVPAEYSLFYFIEHNLIPFSYLMCICYGIYLFIMTILLNYSKKV